MIPFGHLGRRCLPSLGERRFLRTAPTDVVDPGRAYRIFAEVPGIPREDLDIRIRGSSVEIKGEAADEIRKESEGFLHREASYSGYHRSFELPEPVVSRSQGPCGERSATAGTPGAASEPRPGRDQDPHPVSRFRDG